MMDSFDDVRKRMLGKEWLAKVDIETTTPYLLKFHAEESELACSLMITDTKSIWFETLTSNQLARRWRECHPLKSISNLSSKEEELWRSGVLKCLSAAHTIGNFADISFEVVKSRYSDFAFELRLEDFIFRWETNIAGHRLSAEVISTQLIIPLMSTAHLAFSSPDSVGEMSESNLETVVDKLGRSARRAPGMHTRNAISRPRLATAIRRMTAMLNFLVELPNIQLNAEKLNISSPDLTPATATSEIQIVEQSMAAADIEMGEPASPKKQPKEVPDWLGSTQTKAQYGSRGTLGTGPPKTEPDDDSATEDSDDSLILKKPAPPAKASNTRLQFAVDRKKVDHSSSSLESTKEGQKPTKKTLVSDSSPPPAGPPVTKKAKQAASCSSDSEKGSGAAAGPSTRRGARQPIKRGGRRF